MADFMDRDSVTKSGRITGNRDIVVAPSPLRWLAEGKVFEGGFGMEDAEENDSGSAFDDTKGTFALQSPSGTSTLVVPILLKVMLTSDGGGAAGQFVAFTRPASDCATSMTISGTSLTFRRNLNRLYSSQGQAKAVYGDTITVSALTNADYVAYDFKVVMDATLSNTHLSGNTGVATYNFLNAGVPHILANGAAMIVYRYTASSDSVAKVYMQWAELEADDLY